MKREKKTFHNKILEIVSSYHRQFCGLSVPFPKKVYRFPYVCVHIFMLMSILGLRTFREETLIHIYQHDIFTFNYGKLCKSSQPSILYMT